MLYAKWSIGQQCSSNFSYSSEENSKIEIEKSKKHQIKGNLVCILYEASTFHCRPDPPNKKTRYLLLISNQHQIYIHIWATARHMGRRYIKLLFFENNFQAKWGLENWTHIVDDTIYSPYVRGYHWIWICFKLSFFSTNEFSAQINSLIRDEGIYLFIFKELFFPELYLA